MTDFARSYPSPSPLQFAGITITRTQRRDAVVLRVDGDVDMSTAPRLVSAVEDALRAAPPVLVLDLDGIEFLASCGLTALLTVYRLAGPSATALRIAVTTRAVLRPIQLTGLEPGLPLHSSVDEALAEG